MQAGEWWHSINHDEPYHVVDTDTLWGQETCLVWLPRRGAAVRVLQKRLLPLKSGESHLLDCLSYISSAARIADALEDEEQVWTRELATREAALPDLAAVLMVRVAPTGGSL